jgi:hypothetical protein
MATEQQARRSRIPGSFSYCLYHVYANIQPFFAVGGAQIMRLAWDG